MEPICIIIVTYNAEKWLSKSIERLKEVPTGSRILVVDNASSDGTCEIINRKYPNVTLIKFNTNLGFGQANNHGLIEALKQGYSWFLLLNQDAYISWENINKLMVVAKLETDFGIISPINLFSDDEIDFTHRKYILNKNEELLSDLLIKGNCKDIYEYEITNAAIWLLPYNTIKLVGGFDPLFFHYGEDNDYCLRALNMNLKVGVCPKIIGYHYRPQDNSNFVQNKNFYYVDYMLRLIYNRSNICVIYLRIFKEIFFKVIRLKCGLSILKFTSLAYWEVMVNYRSIKSRRKTYFDSFRFLDINSNVK